MSFGTLCRCCKSKLAQTSFLQHWCLLFDRIWCVCLSSHQNFLLWRQAFLFQEILFLILNFFCKVTDFRGLTLLRFCLNWMIHNMFVGNSDEVEMKEFFSVNSTTNRPRQTETNTDSYSVACLFNLTFHVRVKCKFQDAFLYLIALTST